MEKIKGCGILSHPQESFLSVISSPLFEIYNNYLSNLGEG